MASKSFTSSIGGSDGTLLEQTQLLESPAPISFPNALKASAYYLRLLVLKATEVNPQLRHHIRAGIFDELDLLLVFVQHLHIDAQTLQLFYQHFEGFGHARLHDA